MSERKVLNKYFPPDFDPSKIPKRVKAKNEQHKVRLMAPFSMHCVTCGNWIAKSTKFNARKETVEGEMYLTIKIFRFYIRCPRCSAEITFKTDPKSADYVCEHGALRNFDSSREERLATEEMKLEKEKQEEDNPMKALENRTLESKKEMDILDALDEIRTRNARSERLSIDEVNERLMHRKQQSEEERRKAEEEEIDRMAKATFKNEDGDNIRRLADSEIDLTATTLRLGTTSTLASASASTPQGLGFLGPPSNGMTTKTNNNNILGIRKPSQSQSQGLINNITKTSSSSSSDTKKRSLSLDKELWKGIIRKKPKNNATTTMTTAATTTNSKTTNSNQAQKLNSTTTTTMTTTTTTTTTPPLTTKKITSTVTPTAAAAASQNPLSSLMSAYDSDSDSEEDDD